MALISPLFDNFYKEAPAVLPRAERRAAWRASRKKLTQGTHAERTGQFRRGWGNLVGVFAAKEHNRKKLFAKHMEYLSVPAFTTSEVNGEKVHTMKQLKDRIIEVLKKPNGSIGMSALAAALSSPVWPVCKEVGKLVREGVVQRVAKKNDKGSVKHVIYRTRAAAPVVTAVTEAQEKQEETQLDGTQTGG